MKRCVWQFAAAACLVAAFAAGCGSRGNRVSGAAPSDAVAVGTDIVPAPEPLVHTIPDSLRTPGQQQLCDRLRQTVAEYLRVEDGRLVFTLSEREFLERGIPKVYYDKLLQDLADANRWADSIGEVQLEQLLREAYPLPQ